MRAEEESVDLICLYKDHVVRLNKDQGTVRLIFEPTFLMARYTTVNKTVNFLKLHYIKAT